MAVTELQRRQAARLLWWAHVRFGLFLASFLLGATFLAVAGYMGVRMIWFQGGRGHPAIEAHFKYGSIGAELASGMPYRMLEVLPKVFPEHFAPEGDWSHFGLVLEGATDEHGTPRYDIYTGQRLARATADDRSSRGLPIGFASGWRAGVEVAWFNCAVCHTGLVEVPGSTRPRIVPGMPANTVELERLFLALFEMAVDKRFTLAAFEAQFPPERRLNVFERMLWEWVVVPNTRNTLIARRSELLPLLDPKRASSARISTPGQCLPRLEAISGCDPSFEIETKRGATPSRPDDTTRWGPGRVDTFNPYKLINFGIEADCLDPAERTGVSDFPSIFYQGPRGRKGMHLHWDGNNASLRERNLSAALGAGVNERTVDHASLERLENWLDGLAPPPSPYASGLDPARVAAGRGIYMRECAGCHGYQGTNGYVFEGARLGMIEPIQYVDTDRGRLDSYTREMEKYQKDRLFCASPVHRFRQFKKTGGYANIPLDGLWLRAPYLHNGSVPTLADLLERPENRPPAFRRGRRHIRLDSEKGGFEAPACIPAEGQEKTAGSFCFDTALPGNSSRGHAYGTDLTAVEKDQLLGYLQTF
jgi:hypothetical protein